MLGGPCGRRKKTGIYWSEGVLMKRCYSIALVLLMGLAESFAQSPRIFISTELGITMVPPTVEPTFEQAFTVCGFYFPSSNGFSANVNVQYQPFYDSIAAFDKLSSNQFDQLQFTILNRSLSTDSVTYEYCGLFQGRNLHWYSVAKKLNTKIYLITATALESDWGKLSDTLRNSVDSFELMSILGLDPSTFGAHPKESEFWKVLAEIDKVIYVRGLLDGMISEKTMSYLILQELDKLSATMTIDQKKTRQELTDQYRAVNQDINDKIKQAYNNQWQQECVKFIDEFYDNPKNIEKPLSTVFFYYLNKVFNWGYSVY